MLMKGVGGGGRGGHFQTEEHKLHHWSRQFQSDDAEFPANQNVNSIMLKGGGGGGTSKQKT